MEGADKACALDRKKPATGERTYTQVVNRTATRTYRQRPSWRSTDKAHAVVASAVSWCISSVARGNTIRRRGRDASLRRSCTRDRGIIVVDLGLDAAPIWSVSNGDEKWTNIVDKAWLELVRRKVDCCLHNVVGV